MKSTTRIRWHAEPARPALERPEGRDAWNGLNRGRLDLPFLGAEAVCLGLEVFGSGKERLLVGRQGGREVAMFVVAPQGRLRWQTFQPSQLPLGCWVAAPGLSLSHLADCLLRALPGCLAVTVTQVDPLFAERGSDGECIETQDYIETAWVDIGGSFDDYWTARGKNLRQNMRKQRNKLATEGVRTAMLVHTRPEQMAGALERYGALESAGWKAGEGTAIHPDNAQGRFYCRLLEGAAAAGEAVVYEYHFDGRCVAMNLCLRRGGVLVVLKTTYDESIRTLSPAFLLREEELQAIHREREIRRIEYYGRLMDWHTKLTDHKRVLYHQTHYRFAWLKRLALQRRLSRVAVAAPASASAPGEAPAAP